MVRFVAMNVQGSRLNASLELRRIEERYWTFRTFVRSAAVCIVAYFAFEAVQKLAGQNTVVDVALSLALNVLAKLEIVIAVALTGATTAWALIERALRRRKVDHMQGRIRELETRLDPKRSTSGLTPKGKTNPRDIRR
jgi:hypothetical protein